MGDSTVRAWHPARPPAPGRRRGDRAGRDAAARGGPQRGGLPGAGAGAPTCSSSSTWTASPGRRWCRRTPTPPATVPTCCGRDRSPTCPPPGPGGYPLDGAGRPRRPAPRTAGPRARRAPPRRRPRPVLVAVLRRPRRRVAPVRRLLRELRRLRGRGHRLRRERDLGRPHPGLARGARAYHQHHPSSSPPVQHLADILRNGALFRRRWGRWPMEGWLR